MNDENMQFGVSQPSEGSACRSTSTKYCGDILNAYWVLMGHGSAAKVGDGYQAPSRSIFSVLNPPKSNQPFYPTEVSKSL